MLKNSNLRNYIKLIIESIEDDEEEYKRKYYSDLESKYNDDILAKNTEQYNQNTLDKSSPTGWNLLNHTIESLKALDDPQQHPQDLRHKYAKAIDIIKHDLNFKKIGDGAFRYVYSRPDAPFVIKLEQSKWVDQEQKMGVTGTNKVEYDIYFDYGPNYQHKNEIFPKVYAYDQIDGMWIIAEKVIPFEDYSDFTIMQIFKPIFTLFSQIINFLRNDIAFKNSPDNPLYNPQKDIGKNVFETHFFERLDMEIYSNPYCEPSYVMGKCFSFTKEVAKEANEIGDLSLAFKKNIIEWIIKECRIFGAPFSHYEKVQKQLPHKLNIFIKIFEKAFPNLKPTPDVAYLANILKHKEIEDLHFANLGHRDMKNNPNQPWKNFVILDYAEYGGTLQNPAKTTNLY